MSNIPNGMFVNLATKTRPDLNVGLWRVEMIDPNKPDRLIVARLDDEVPDSVVPLLQVSVTKDSVVPLAMVPASRQPVPPTGAANQFEYSIIHYLGGGNTRPNDTGSSGSNRSDGIDDDLLDKWFDLEGLGRNPIYLRRTDDPNYHLYMFPLLQDHGLELFFHSSWGQVIILLKDFDYLKTCPQEQVWPWCAWCHKFLMPEHAHRETLKHQNALWWAHSNGKDWGMKEVRARYENK